MCKSGSVGMCIASTTVIIYANFGVYIYTNIQMKEQKKKQIEVEQEAMKGGANT